MGLSHREARTVLLAAFAARGMASPSLSELQLAQAVGSHETSYGGGWKGEGAGSNNWGAISCGHVAPCGPNCFENGDSHADGSTFRGCFQRYSSPEAGAADLLHELYRRPGVPEAMQAGDARAMATAMRASGYFEATADSYTAALVLNATAIAHALGEPLRVGDGANPALPPPGPPPGVPAMAPPQDDSGGGFGGLPLVLSLLVAGAAKVRR